MANEVYANGHGLACKAGQGKSICTSRMSLRAAPDTGHTTWDTDSLSQYRGSTATPPTVARPS